MKPQVEALQASVAGGTPGAISALIAGERNRLSIQELSLGGEHMQAELVRERKLRELAAWGKFDVYTQRNECQVSKKVVQRRLVSTWKMVDGKMCVKARLVAKGFQDPDLQEERVDTSGCLRLRSSRLRVFFIIAIKKWGIWGVDIKIAFLQADGFVRDVFLHAPGEWDPLCRERVWDLEEPAYGLNDAPVASYRSSKKYLLGSEASAEGVGLRCEASTFDPCHFFVFRAKGVSFSEYSRPVLMTFLCAANRTYWSRCAFFLNVASGH